MKRINFRTKYGESITICPFAYLKEDESVIRVGSKECISCKHYLSGSIYAKIVRCTCVYGETFNDGIEAAIDVIRTIFESFPYNNQRVFVIKALEKLKR